MKKKGKETETQGKVTSCTGARQPSLTMFLYFVCESFLLLSSDQTEDASQQGDNIQTGAGRRQKRRHRGLPPVQAASGWQRGAFCPAHI